MKPNYFHSSCLIGEKTIKILFPVSRTGNTLLLYSSERRRTKINFSQNILSPLLFFISLSQCVQYRDVSINVNIRRTKLPKILNNRTKTTAITSQLFIPKNETLVFTFQVIKLKQKIIFIAKQWYKETFKSRYIGFGDQTVCRN